MDSPGPPASQRGPRRFSCGAAATVGSAAPVEIAIEVEIETEIIADYLSGVMPLGHAVAR